MMRRGIRFLSDGAWCVGWLYVPSDLQAGQHAPGIVMANAISAVKEITLPGYAERFCDAGFVVLAFDYRYFGASEGTPRNHILPHEQQQDVRNAITWLRAQAQVDADNIGGWGISLGGVHMLYLGAYDRRLKAVVSVATGLNTLETMMGRETMQGFLGIINRDRDLRLKAGEDATYIPAVSMPGGGAAMAFPEAYEFYTEAMNSYAPAYENRLTFESMEYLIGDHSADAIHLIAPTALLMIHGERDLIPPEAVRAVFERAGEPKKLVVYDCLHTDLYVRDPWVTQSADEAIAWFNHYLHNPRAKSAVKQDSERNAQVIRDFYDQTNAGNFGVYDTLFAPDFVSYTSATGFEIRGSAGFKAANAMYMASFPDFQTKVEMIVAEDDLVMAYGVLSGTNEGEFMGNAATGKKVEWTGIAIYRFNDEDQIDGRWQEFDGLGLYQQLGLIPTAGGAA